jgi:VWFA-related protein
MRRAVVVIWFIVPLALRAQSDGLQTRVLVSPPEGIAVADINAAELLLQVDGHRVDHGTPVTLSTVPLRIAIVLDVSGSARRSTLLSSLHQHVLGWAACTLGRHGGDAFLVGFNDQIIISTEIVTDISQLRRALNQLHPIGGSAIRDAVVHSTQKFYALGPEPQPTARVLLLVSDGFDNASYAKERNAVESAKRWGVRIYAISFDSPEAEAGRKLLQVLSQGAGGKAFSPSNDSEVSSVLTAVDRDLANSFLVSFASGVRDGKFHHLSVKLLKIPNATLRYNSEFYAPPEP